MNTMEKPPENVTNLVAAKRVRVDPAHLPPAKRVNSNNNNNSNQSASSGGPIGSDIEDARRRCTLYRLLTGTSAEDEKELGDMVIIAKDCLASQGILPITASDENDALEADRVLSNLLSDRFRPVFRRCYLLGVLTICPLFFKALVTRYNVNAAKLDALVNNPESRYSIDYTNYSIGKIADANMFVARMAVLWLQVGGPVGASSGIPDGEKDDEDDDTHEAGSRLLTNK